MTMGSDFHLINFKCEGPNRKSSHYKLEDVGPDVSVEELFPDEKELNQLFIRYGPTIQLFRTGPKKPQEILNEYNPLIFNDVQWSPLGSYSVSLVGDMAVLSGFRNSYYYPSCKCYYHSEVKVVDFSPGEKYLVTYNQPKHGAKRVKLPNHAYCEPKHAPEPTMPSELQIFDVRTGMHMMGAYDSGVADVSWPAIRWAGGKDDRYFATLGKNTISVYETDTFNLLGEKRMEVENVADMCWSPTESIFALLKGFPPKVALVEIPGMVELKYMELPNDVNTADCKMYWQSNGEHLAVKFERSVFIFSCIKEKERDIHMEVLEVDEKIHAFAWEPSGGHRFAMIIHRGKLLMPHVSFYSMEETRKVSKLATFKDKKADTLFWSPRGKHIVLAGLNGSFNGNLEFFDVDKLQTMTKVEHPKANVVAWDPTGRYVATAYTISPEMEKGFKIGFEPIISNFEMYPFQKRTVARTRNENGFNLWSWNGEKVYWKSTPKEYRLLQLNWRPYGGIIDDEILKNLENVRDYEDEDEDDDEMMAETMAEIARTIKLFK